MLVGTTTRLRAVERDDLPRLVAWLNDPEVRMHLAMHKPLSLAEEQRWFDGLLGSTHDQVFVIEAISDADVGGGHRPIGTCGAHKIDWKNRNCAVGIALGDKDSQGKGYGTDAMRTLLRYLFDELGLHRVELEVFGDNDRAQSSYEKVGFRKEGVRRHAMFRHGKWQDLVLMSCLQGELGATGARAQGRRAK